MEDGVLLTPEVIAQIEKENAPNADKEEFEKYSSLLDQNYVKEASNRMMYGDKSNQLLGFLAPAKSKQIQSLADFDKNIIGRASKTLLGGTTLSEMKEWYNDAQYRALLFDVAAKGTNAALLVFNPVGKIGYQIAANALGSGMATVFQEISKGEATPSEIAFMAGQTAIMAGALTKYLPIAGEKIKETLGPIAKSASSAISDVFIKMPKPVIERVYQKNFYKNPPPTKLDYAEKVTTKLQDYETKISTLYGETFDRIFGKNIDDPIPIKIDQNVNKAFIRDTLIKRLNATGEKIPQVRVAKIDPQTNKLVYENTEYPNVFAEGNIVILPVKYAKQAYSELFKASEMLPKEKPFAPRATGIDKVLDSIRGSLETKAESIKPGLKKTYQDLQDAYKNQVSRLRNVKTLFNVGVSAGDQLTASGVQKGTREAKTAPMNQIAQEYMKISKRGSRSQIIDDIQYITDDYNKMKKVDEVPINILEDLSDIYSYQTLEEAGSLTIATLMRMGVGASIGTKLGATISGGEPIITGISGIAGAGAGAAFMGTQEGIESFLKKKKAGTELASLVFKSKAAARTYYQAINRGSQEWNKPEEKKSLTEILYR